MAQLYDTYHGQITGRTTPACTANLNLVFTVTLYSFQTLVKGIDTASALQDAPGFSRSRSGDVDIGPVLIVFGSVLAVLLRGERCCRVERGGAHPQLVPTHPGANCLHKPSPWQDNNTTRYINRCLAWPALRWGYTSTVEVHLNN